MDLTKKQKEILIEALTVLKFEVEGKKVSKHEEYEDIVKLTKFVERSHVALYPKLSDEENSIIHDKLCPDCNADLEYQEADPSGRDCDVYFCPECFDNPDLDGKPHKEFLIWFERRDTAVQVQEI